MSRKIVTGYHGTGVSSSKQIMESGFKPSVGDDHWLGDGAYFFVDGLPPSPQISAEKWAKAESWDKTTRRYKYKKYAVIKGDIHVDEDLFLDLTTDEGLEVFDYIRNQFIKKLASARLLMSDKDAKDGKVINAARREGILEIEVVKGNFYIKFAEERRFNINFRTPNVTICAVFNPSNNLDEQSIKIIKTGEVLDEIK